MFTYGEISLILYMTLTPRCMLHAYSLDDHETTFNCKVKLILQKTHMSFRRNSGYAQAVWLELFIDRHSLSSLTLKPVNSKTIDCSRNARNVKKSDFNSSVNLY